MPALLKRPGRTAPLQLPTWPAPRSKELWRWWTYSAHPLWRQHSPRRQQMTPFEGPTQQMRRRSASHPQWREWRAEERNWPQCSQSHCYGPCLARRALPSPLLWMMRTGDWRLSMLARKSVAQLPQQDQLSLTPSLQRSGCPCPYSATSTPKGCSFVRRAGRARACLQPGSAPGWRPPEELRWARCLSA